MSADVALSEKSNVDVLREVFRTHIRGLALLSVKGSVSAPPIKDTPHLKIHQTHIVSLHFIPFLNVQKMWGFGTYSVQTFTTTMKSTIEDGPPVTKDLHFTGDLDSEGWHLAGRWKEQGSQLKGDLGKDVMLVVDEDWNGSFKWGDLIIHVNYVD
jgi:hypothetical protein